MWSRGKEEERSLAEGQGFIYTVFTDELRLHLIHQKQASSDGASKVDKVDIQSNEHLKKTQLPGSVDQSYQRSCISAPRDL